MQTTWANKTGTMHGLAYACTYRSKTPSRYANCTPHTKPPGTMNITNTLSGLLLGRTLDHAQDCRTAAGWHAIFSQPDTPLRHVCRRPSEPDSSLEAPVGIATILAAAKGNAVPHTIVAYWPTRSWN
jgi:hypothetical protein